MTSRHSNSYAAWVLAAVLSLAATHAIAQTVTAADQKSAQASSDAKTASPAKKGAQPAEEPDTLILSDTLKYDDIKRQSVFTGNVIMTRGLLKLTSDVLTMHEDADGFQYGVATADKGKLVHVRQENPEKYEVIESEGLRAEYDGKKEDLVMIGQAVITRIICGKPLDSIKGERVIYHQKTDTYEAFSGAQSAASGGRVRSLARPRSQADAALLECQKKSAASH